ncbi:MAG TPA: hypothetical protein DCG10_06545 [Lachnospiraceae bacterium]|nr:hypothetical protein [Lachnospiraceae bacterium]
MTIEIVIIVMLLASLFGAWVLSVWRKLEMQEENIRNALHQTLVQFSAEREALEGLTELLKDVIDAELLQEMRCSLENAQDGGEVRQPEWISERQRELLKVQNKIAEISEGMPLLQTQETYQKYWKAAKSYEHMVETSGLIYNDSVESYNGMFHKMPDRMAAGICGFHRKKMIEIM